MLACLHVRVLYNTTSFWHPIGKPANKEEVFRRPR